MKSTGVVSACRDFGECMGLKNNQIRMTAANVLGGQLQGTEG